MTTVAVQTLVIEPIWKTESVGRLDSRLLVQEPVRRRHDLVLPVRVDAEDPERRSGDVMSLGQLGQAPLPVLGIEARQPPTAGVARVLLDPVDDALVEVDPVRRLPLQHEQV